RATRRRRGRTRIPDIRAPERRARRADGRTVEGRAGGAGWKGGRRTGLRAGQRRAGEARRRLGARRPQARTPLNSRRKAAVLAFFPSRPWGAAHRFPRPDATSGQAVAPPRGGYLLPALARDRVYAAARPRGAPQP